MVNGRFIYNVVDGIQTYVESGLDLEQKSLMQRKLDALAQSDDPSPAIVKKISQEPRCFYLGELSMHRLRKSSSIVLLTPRY